VITDEMVRKFYDAYMADIFRNHHNMKAVKAGLLAVQDDMTRLIIESMTIEIEGQE